MGMKGKTPSDDLWIPGKLIISALQNANYY
jgi:hypothetical protein